MEAHNFYMSSMCRYILSSHKKLSWDVNVINIIINVPWSKAMPEEYKLVIPLYRALLLIMFCGLLCFVAMRSFLLFKVTGEIVAPSSVCWIIIINITTMVATRMILWRFASYCDHGSACAGC